MIELKPCPFCGSDWLYQTQKTGYGDYTPVMFCNSCKAVVTWEQVEEEGVSYETSEFVREHWNSRAYEHQQKRIAELEELVRDMYACISHANEQDWFHFERDKVGCGMSCTVNGEECGLLALADRMAKLGVEMDE